MTGRDPEKGDNPLFEKQKREAAPGACAARGARSRLPLNIDLGERGADHRVDHALAAHADLINLACGGHAGDAASVAAFSALAARHGARLTAHLSYPDRAHFGRRPLALPFDQLARALDAQRTLLPEPDHVKLHGALYHAADTDPLLAAGLARWLRGAGFTTVLTPDPGALAHTARKQGLAVLAEVFAERRYHRDPATGTLGLLQRENPAACITTLDDALAQAQRLIADRTVALHPEGTRVPLRADTLCLHSDSPIALPLAAALADGQRKGPEA